MSEKSIEKKQTTIRLLPNLLKKGKSRAKKMGVPFGDYLAILIDRDLKTKFR